jgi:hypothetical protein
MWRSRWRPTRARWRRGASRAIGGRGQPDIAGGAGAGRRRPAPAGTPARRRRGAAAFGVARALFDRVSFDLIYARQDQTLAAWKDELLRALADGGGPSVALPADDRGRHGLRCACRRGEAAGACRRRACDRDVRADAGAVRRRRDARLRGVEPRAAGGGIAAQPDLLALGRLGGDRAGCAWPADAGGAAAGHRDGAGAGRTGSRGWKAGAQARRPARRWTAPSRPRRR